MQLRRADVLAGALALLDADGLDGLTMRKLAARLGVQVGALYWHYASKQDLLDAMAEKLVEGVGDPFPPGPWDQQLAALASRLRHALLARRDGARVVAGTYVTGPNTVLAAKTAVDILRAAGLPPARAGWAGFTLARYVLGHTIEEQARAELAADGAWQARQAAAAEQAGPGYADPLGTLFGADPDDLFTYGITVFIDGIRHQLQPDQPPAGPG